MTTSPSAHTTLAVSATE